MMPRSMSARSNQDDYTASKRSFFCYTEKPGPVLIEDRPRFYVLSPGGLLEGATLGHGLADDQGVDVMRSFVGLD